MGTDIHAVVQVYKAVEGQIARQWVTVPEPEKLLTDWDREWYAEHPDWRQPYRWYRDRNYDTFAILADVRNGYGFAGCPTSQGFNVISEPRGLPEDFVLGTYEEDGETYDDGHHGVWMGDHDHSWLTLQEIVDFNWDQGTIQYGIISTEEFLERVKQGDKGAPENYCGGVGGKGVAVVEEPAALEALKYGDSGKKELQAYSHVRVSWFEGYKAATGRFYGDYIPALKELAETEAGGDYSRVRIVFGFDS